MMLGLSQSNQVCVDTEEITWAVGIPLSTVNIFLTGLYFFFSSGTFSLMLSHCQIIVVNCCMVEVVCWWVYYGEPEANSV